MQQYLTRQRKQQNTIERWLKTNQWDTSIIVITQHKYKYKLKTKQSCTSVIVNVLKINYLAMYMYTTILKKQDGITTEESRVPG